MSEIRCARPHTRCGQDVADIAASLEADSRLLPFLPDLLQDFNSLGCTPKAIVTLARATGISSVSRVLELCCGKGAAAIALATSLRCRVHGIDLYPPMVTAAATTAATAGVSELCTFEVANARHYVAQRRNYDGVLMSAAGGVLGGPRDTVAILRRAVRAGGWILIEDGYLPDDYQGSIPRGYEHYLTHTPLVQELTAFGDMLVEELVLSEEERWFNIESVAKIRKRATELAAQHVEMADLFFTFVEQQAELSAAAEAMISALWLIRKADQEA